MFRERNNSIRFLCLACIDESFWPYSKSVPLWIRFETQMMRTRNDSIVTGNMIWLQLRYSPTTRRRSNRRRRWPVLMLFSSKALKTETLYVSRNTSLFHLFCTLSRVTFTIRDEISQKHEPTEPYQTDPKYKRRVADLFNYCCVVGDFYRHFYGIFRQRAYD